MIEHHFIAIGILGTQFGPFSIDQLLWSGIDTKSLRVIQALTPGASYIDKDGLTWKICDRDTESKSTACL